MGSTERLSEERWISFGPEMASIPERLLLAHARGEVLFITGAGISMPAGLPDFRDLVLKVYKALEGAMYQILKDVPREVCSNWSISTKGLDNQQSAEVKRFLRGDYDVVLGMLERRMDGRGARASRVRNAVTDILRNAGDRPASIHRALVRLADRGAATTIVTTNFDLLLEAAARGQRKRVQSYALGGIPRPGRSEEFAGVLHIHGVLSEALNRFSDLIVTDQDFGEFYLRRRIIPDFIYDSARLFHLVLVGYSANDAPMRYLLNAVAADGSRFDDLKERFAFVSMGSQTDPVAIEDWKGRGITPIPYSSADKHIALRKTLHLWSELSAINGRPERVDATLRRLIRTGRSVSSDADRDLFDHLIRRSATNERQRMSALVSQSGAGLDWLDAIAAVGREPKRERL